MRTKTERKNNKKNGITYTDAGDKRKRKKINYGKPTITEENKTNSIINWTRKRIMSISRKNGHNRDR